MRRSLSVVALSLFVSHYAHSPVKPPTLHWAEASVVRSAVLSVNRSAEALAR